MMLFVGVLAMAFTSCKKDGVVQIDNLEQSGILGKWERESYVVNGISSLAVDCCVYLEFQKDSEPDDLKGEFKATDFASETNGVFELNTSNNTIEFTYDDKQRLYEMQISDSFMTFSYSEDNDAIVEGWRKEE